MRRPAAIIQAMKAACPLCGRKAQRACPALSQTICSQCCGKGRRRTINCPGECPHVVAGIRLALRRLAELSGDHETEIEHADVLHNLRLALVQLRFGRLKDLTDEEARQALASVADTMRTRSHGLVYDFRSPDPRIQMAVDGLTEIAGLHERGERGFSRISPTDLLACLRYLERQAREAIAQARGPHAWLDIIMQSVGTRFAGSTNPLLVSG